MDMRDYGTFRVFNCVGGGSHMEHATLIHVRKLHIFSDSFRLCVSLDMNYTSKFEDFILIRFLSASTPFGTNKKDTKYHNRFQQFNLDDRAQTHISRKGEIEQFRCRIIPETKLILVSTATVHLQIFWIYTGGVERLTEQRLVQTAFIYALSDMGLKTKKRERKAVDPKPIGRIRKPEV